MLATALGTGILGYHPQFRAAGGRFRAPKTEMRRALMRILERRFFMFGMLLVFAAGFSAKTSAQDEGDAWGKKKSSWLLLTPAEKTQVQDFSEDFKSYLNVA